MAKHKVLNEEELHNRIQESSLTHLAETQKVKPTLDNLMSLAVTLNSDLGMLFSSSD